MHSLGFVVDFQELLGEVRWAEVGGFEAVQMDSSVAVLECLVRPGPFEGDLAANPGESWVYLEASWVAGEDL